MAFALTFILVFQLCFIAEAKTPNTKPSFKVRASNTYIKRNQLEPENGLNNLFKLDQAGKFTMKSLLLKSNSISPNYEAICPLYGTHRMLKYGTVDIYSGNSIYSTLRYAGWMFFVCNCGANICVKSDAFMYSNAPIGYYLTDVTILAGKRFAAIL